MQRYYYSDKGFVESADWSKGDWIDVECPDESDRRFLIDKLGVPEMFLEYLGDIDERPRIEREGEWQMAIVRIPVESDDKGAPFTTVPLGIISNPRGVLLTLCYHPNAMIPDFVDHTRRKQIKIEHLANFVLRIIYSTAFWYLKYLKMLTNDVTGAEKHLERSIRNDDLIWLMHLQRSLVFFSTGIKGNITLLDRLQRIYGNQIDPELMEDVEIELKQADTTVDIYTDILEGTMDSFASIISNNVNGIMKRMTGLSIILMVPTFIASLYGMNVDILIGGSRYAFWIILLLAFILTALAFLLLRHMKWV